METSSVFGAGTIASLYNDGATVKRLIASSTLGAGVLFDVQEKGFFSIQEEDASSTTEVTITIDGKSFSGEIHEIIAALGGDYKPDITEVSYTQMLPYSTSLKVEVTNYGGGSFTVTRVS